MVERRYHFEKKVRWRPKSETSLSCRIGLSSSLSPVRCLCKETRMHALMLHSMPLDRRTLLQDQLHGPQGTMRSPHLH